MVTGTPLFSGCVGAIVFAMCPPPPFTDDVWQATGAADAIVLARVGSVAPTSRDRLATLVRGAVVGSAALVGAVWQDAGWVIEDVAADLPQPGDVAIARFEIDEEWVGSGTLRSLTMDIPRSTLTAGTRVVLFLERSPSGWRTVDGLRGVLPLSRRLDASRLRPAIETAAALQSRGSAGPADRAAWAEEYGEDGGGLIRPARSATR